MNMEIQRPRRRWLVVALVLAMAIAIGFVAFQALDAPSPIEYYRVRCGARNAGSTGERRSI